VGRYLKERIFTGRERGNKERKELKIMSGKNIRQLTAF
jgi:hypothetical protein